MRYLFVHQNFPGQFLHLIRRLNARPDAEIVFISEPNANALEGVRRANYLLPRGPSAEAHIFAREFDMTMLRSECVNNVAIQLKTLGFVPDVIIGHHGWGELLNIMDVFPDVPVIGYFVFYYNLRTHDINYDPEFPFNDAMQPLVRARNNINHLALTNPGIGITPTLFQLRTYPDWAQRKIRLLREGVNLDICKPNKQVATSVFRLGAFTVPKSAKLLTFVCRNLEPYRGFHSMMRALVPIMRARKDVYAILVGGDEVSYGAPPDDGGSWREVMMREVGDKLDLSRILFAGRVEYDDYLRMLQRSDVHVYLSYPFVASWSMREAMACACAIVGSDTDTVTEFITHEETGLLVDLRDPKALADACLRMLKDTKLASRLRAAARAWAEKHLRMDEYLDAYEALIAEQIAAAKAGRAVPAKPQQPPAPKPAAGAKRATGVKKATTSKQAAAAKPPATPNKRPAAKTPPARPATRRRG